MTEQGALAKMIAPGTRRPGKYREGVIQVWVTRACDKACFNCTQGSNLAGKLEFMSPQHFDRACQSLKGYWGVVGVFGGNPALHPQFPELCRILSSYFPFGQRGLWCNHPRSHGRIMRQTFNPSVSNLNVHLDQEAHAEFLRDWPESRPFGLHEDSRHAPVHLAMKDVLKKNCSECKGIGVEPGTAYPEGVGDEYEPCHACEGSGEVYDEAKAWELISGCDINKHWSAMIGVFRGQLRAWFCEVAGAQAMLHQWDTNQADVKGKACTCGADRTGPSAETHDDSCPVKVKFTYPDTGLDLAFWARQWGKMWWELPMQSFVHQVRKHCHECGVPLRGHGELAQAAEGTEQTSKTHEAIYRPKRPGRKVEVVTELVQLGSRLGRMTDYLGNAKR